MERANSYCILCGGAERRELFKQKDWTVYECSQCGLGVLDPRPDQKELKLLYGQAYFDDQYKTGLEPDTPEMARRLSQEKHRIRFFRSVKKRGRILDMGCGMGYFLCACREHGYEVEGMDISDDAAAYVRNTLKIKVTAGQLEAFNFAEHAFDVITMWHFLEHCQDPHEYLKYAWKWLKPGGVLVVDVPNYIGTDARKTWNDWKGWQLPFHLYHFTPETLCRILKQNGFKPIRKKDYLSEYVKEHLEARLKLRFLARMVAQFYSGHSYVVVARKI